MIAASDELRVMSYELQVMSLLHPVILSEVEGSQDSA